MAGLVGLLPHDFRRTAVRNLERAGVPRSVAMKLVGHKTEAMYRRYAIVSPRDLTEGVASWQPCEKAGTQAGTCLGTTLGTIALRWYLRLPRDVWPKIFRHRYFSRTLGGVAQLVEQGTFNP
jgi:hypothetical protein